MHPSPPLIADCADKPKQRIRRQRGTKQKINQGKRAGTSKVTRAKRVQKLGRQENKRTGIRKKESLALCRPSASNEENANKFSLSQE